MVATRRLKDAPDRMLMLGARMAARGERTNERGAMLLFNPNHDSKGLFASGGGSGGGGGKGGHSNIFTAPVSPELKAAGDRIDSAKTARDVRAAYKEYGRQLDIHIAKYSTGVSKRSAEIRLRSAELAKVAGSKKSSPEEAQKARDELNALKREQVQVKAELDPRYKGVRRYDNYGKTVAKSTAKTTTSHTTGRMSKANRAAQNAELVKQGYRDWSSGHAYLSNAGHYRVRETDASGRGTGKSHAAPWSKAVKSAHANNSEFHQAAETYAKAHPNEIPAHYITSAGVRQTSEPSKPMRRTLRFPDALQRVQRFDETGPDGFHRSWIMLFPVGHYQHEQYGELDFTPAKLQKIKAQYDQRVRHIDAALDVDHRASHDDSRATGWIESLELRDRQPDGTPAGLWGCIKWTPYGLKFLNADEYRYFSPEFGPWDDPQTGEHFEDVLIGGALTNRPFLKTMPAIALADGAKSGGKDVAISRKPWGSIKKSMLPRSAFLIQGDPNKKTTWRLPVYEGTGPLDADGCYTQRGPLNLNGVKAAWAAVNGAHTGEPMSGVPATVIAKLKAWKAQYFPGDGSKTAKQAMEGRVSRKLGGLASVDADLLDDEDEDDESLTLADGRPAKGSAAMKAQMAALRAKSSLKMGKKKSGKSAADDSEDDADELAEDDEDENAAMAEDAEDDETYDEADGDGPDEELAEDADDAEQYADAADAEDDDVDPEDDEEEGDDEGDDEDETPAPKAKSGRSGRSGQRGAGKPMTSKRMMGARTAVSGGAHVRAAEAGRSLTLAEQQRLTEENARLKYQLYEVEVEKTLTEWKRGKFQFKESAKGTPKTGRIALSKAFSDAFRAWMRAEGVRLSEASRTRVLGLVEIALSSAVVDLSERGGSYDPDGRMVASSARRKAGDDDRLQQAAERIALAEHGKSINALTEEPEKVLAIYSRAADEMRY